MLLHCDLVYAAPNALLKLPFIDLGLVPEAASSVLLPRRIGRARSGAALYLGEAIDAAGALQSGLITEIVPDERLDARAAGAAETIAAKPREAVRETKQRLLNYDRAAILDAMDRESRAFSVRLGSNEARAAMASFFSSRAAR